MTTVPAIYLSQTAFLRGNLFDPCSFVLRSTATQTRTTQYDHFSPTKKEELTAGSDEKKKTQRSPTEIRTRVFQTLVGRSNH